MSSGRHTSETDAPRTPSFIAPSGVSFSFHVNACVPFSTIVFTSPETAARFASPTDTPFVVTDSITMPGPPESV